MIKKATINFLIIVLLSGFAYAQDNATEGLSTEQAGYNWLVSEAVNGNYGSDVATTALAGLALSSVGYDGSAKLSADWILTQKDPKNCFPKGDCRTKDTALALMLLNDLAMPEADSVQAWLEGAQAAATSKGKWLIEISTKASGECTISYQLKNQSYEQKVKVEAGKFPSCGNSNFLDIESCYKSGLIKSSPGILLTVDCASLTETPITTLVYSTDSTYYIISTAFEAVTDLKITNGCYSRAASGPCNKESSLYAAWALSTVGSPSNINLYLTENYDAASILNNALLYLSLLTKNDKYIEAIKTRQSADGSWNRDFYETGLALLAMDQSGLQPERVEKAKEWLISKQGTDGSWNNNARETAMILYSAFKNAVLQPESVEDLDPNAVAGQCNSDWICDEDLGETADSCTDCSAFKESEACNADGICDTISGETRESCTDCTCGDGICDDSEDSYSCPDDCEEEPSGGAESTCGDGFCDTDETPDTCPDDCEEEGGIGFGTIILIILAIALVGAVAYLAYKKSRKPEQAAKPSPFGTRPGYGPAFGRTQQPAKTTESDLKKSLEEAKKMLRR